MKAELKYKFENEEAISDLLSAFIDEMIRLGYSEWYIGKAIAHVLRALEKTKKEEW